MNQQMTETVITGMTKGELVAVVSLSLIGIGALIGILGYILRLHLKPLEGLPAKIDKLHSRVLGFNQLEAMIETRVLKCQSECPLRKVNPSALMYKTDTNPSIGKQ